MERLESEVAPQSLLEDDEEDQQPLNEYPDPDSLSTHPWWRDLYLPRDFNNHDEEHVPQAITDGLYTQGQILYRPDTDSLDSITLDTDGSKARVIDEHSIHLALARRQNYDADPTFELAPEDTT